MNNLSNNLNITEEPSYELELFDVVKRVDLIFEDLIEYGAKKWWELGSLVYVFSERFPDKKVTDICRDIWFHSDYREHYTPRTLLRYFYHVDYWVKYREWYLKHCKNPKIGNIEYDDYVRGSEVVHGPTLIRYLSGDKSGNSEEKCDSTITKLSRHISPKIILGKTLKWGFAWLISNYNVPFHEVEKLIDKIEEELWNFAELERYLKKRYGKRRGHSLLCWFCGVELRFEEKDKEWKYEPLCQHCIEKLEEMKG